MASKKQSIERADAAAAEKTGRLSAASDGTGRRRSASNQKTKKSGSRKAEKKSAVPAAASEKIKKQKTVSPAKSKKTASRRKKPAPYTGPRLKVIPLGGLEQIGMNITAFEFDRSIIVVDCGLSFPDEDMLGIDLVIPDVTYLKENLDRVKGFVITHGHEDHIGALPYVLRDVPAPVYATPLTMGIIENKLRELPLPTDVPRHVVEYGDTVRLGDFTVEFININHSIADAAALAITCPVGTCIHTGDFKIDYTPIYGEPADLQRFGQIGKDGVLAMFCDSTNVLREGFTMSERTVGRTFDRIFSDNAGHRIIVATFASNVDRVQQIVNSACKYGRKVVVDGRSMVNIVSVAIELGRLKIPKNTLIDIEELEKYPPHKIVLITTGSQGESMASLSRMAANIHKKVQIQPDDTIILSSNPIPGNEKAVAKIINDLSMRGANVIFQDTHVSGHACQEEIKLMYTLIKPRFAVPVHGEYRHLKAHASLAQSLGIPKENIFVLSSGQVLEFTPDHAEVTGTVPTGGIFVDGLGVGDVGNAVLKDRQDLSRSGIITAVLAIDTYSGELLSGPEIYTRGIVYARESEELLDEIRSEAYLAVLKVLGKGRRYDRNTVRNALRGALSDYFWKKMKRNPVILPILMEI